MWSGPTIADMQQADENLQSWKNHANQLEANLNEWKGYASRLEQVVIALRKEVAGHKALEQAPIDELMFDSLLESPVQRQKVFDQARLAAKVTVTGK